MTDKQKVTIEVDPYDLEILLGIHVHSPDELPPKVREDLERLRKEAGDD